MDRMRLFAIARKEALQLRRDPRSLILAFLLPVALLVFFGYAITWDVKDIRMAVVDQDRTRASRDLVDAFLASGRFTLAASLGRTADIGPLLDRGRVQLALVAQQYSARVLLQTRSVTLPVSADTRIWYNEELSSRNMIVPGLVAVIMMIIAGLLTSLTIAREWERGTMEQLASTPVTRLEVVIGKLLPYLGIGLVDVALCSIVGVALFHVPFRGNPLFLFGTSFAFLTGTLGLGLFISAISRTQLLATQIGMIVTFLPGFLLSGFMFAIENMPLPLRLLTYLVPARYFLVVTRGIFLKGVGPDVLWVQGVLMVLYAVAGLALAVRAFRKEIA
jgi:ABC-2 type transport system permease protein